jgi:hypothetical protein
LRQSGSPVNSSPSNPTEPVSSAMRSVCDSGGSTLRKNFSIGAVTSALRTGGSSSGTVMAATITAATMQAAALAPSSQQATSAQALIAAQVARRMRW